MVKRKKITVGDVRITGPEWWGELESTLEHARAVLWARLQNGNYYNDEEARSLMEAYWAVKRALTLQATARKQIPLPIKEEEEYPPAPVGLIPQEMTYPSTEAEEALDRMSDEEISEAVRSTEGGPS